jgi:hypothetical protein
MEPLSYDMKQHLEDYFHNLIITRLVKGLGALNFIQGVNMRNRNLDLDDLLDSNAKVYVRNNALKSHLLVIVQMEDRAGRKRALKVPPTHYPICISTQFSKDMIRESSDLRDALAKGVLVLMDSKDAEALLRDPDAKEELKSYAMSVYADTAPDNSVRDNLSRMKEQTSVVDAEDVLGGLNGHTMSADDVAPRVQALVASLSNKEKTSKDILVQLKRLKTTLSQSDLTFIIRECEKETQVREFAEGALAELSAAPEQPFQP